MTTSLIIRNDGSLTATHTDEARAMIESALEKGALIGKVENADENAQAALAQREMKTILSDFEKARKQAKAPVLDYGRQIDNILRTEIQEVDREYARIGGLVAQFQLAEKRRVAAAMILEQERLSKLEAEKMEALAKSISPAQHDAILEKFSAAQQQTSVIAPARINGQIVREDWEIEVTNPIELAKWALMSGQWGCIKITPMKSELKSVLDSGATIPGIKASRIAKAGFRASTEPVSIDA